MAEKRFRSVAELRELRKSRVDEDEITVSAGLEHERGGSHGGSGDGSQVAGSAAPSKVARKAKKVGEDGQPAKKVSRKAGSAADTTATETPTMAGEMLIRKAGNHLKCAVCSVKAADAQPQY